MCVVQEAGTDKALAMVMAPAAQPGPSSFVGQLLGPDSVMIPAPETGAPQAPRDPTIVTVQDRRVSPACPTCARCSILFATTSAANLSCLDCISLIPAGLTCTPVSNLYTACSGVRIASSVCVTAVINASPVLTPVQMLFGVPLDRMPARHACRG